MGFPLLATGVIAASILISAATVVSMLTNGAAIRK